MPLALGTCIIKLLKAVWNSKAYKAASLFVVSHFLLAYTNTLAYYAEGLVTNTIGFIIQAQGQGIHTKNPYSQVKNLIQKTLT